MADIHMRRKHSLGVKKAKAAAQKVVDELAQEYGMQSEWDGNVLRFSRHGVDGELAVGKDEVVLQARLGFLLSAFRAKIQEHIDRDFDKYLA